MTSGKTFILGLGAQKAGTTWLHHYLESSKSYTSGGIKEWHIHDLISLDSMQHFRRALESAVKRQALLGDYDQNIGGKSCLTRLAMIKDVRLYYAYFSDLLNSGYTHVGDLTPSYSLLPEQAYNSICTEFANRGINVKAIFLVRDPARRLLSSIRHYRKYIQKNTVPLSFEDECNLVNDLLNTENQFFLARGNYARTIENIKNAFAPTQYFVQMYETMFCDTGMQDLVRFLEIPWSKPQYMNRYMSTGACQIDLPRELVMRIYSYYSDSISACIEFFGVDTLLHAWNDLEEFL